MNTLAPCMRRSLASWLSLLVLLSAACVRAPAEPSVLTIELRAEALEYRVGQAFRGSAELVNPGTEPLTVILPGDGSEVGWRTPVVRWTPALRPMPRCGNTNALSADELVVLQPGQRVELDWLDAPVFQAAGSCAVALELEHDPTLLWNGIPLGRNNPITMIRLRCLAPYRVKSNVVEVTVRD